MQQRNLNKQEKKGPTRGQNGMAQGWTVYMKMDPLFIISHVD